MYPNILFVMVYTYVQHVLRYRLFASVTAQYKGVLLRP